MIYQDLIMSYQNLSRLSPVRKDGCVSVILQWEETRVP